MKILSYFCGESLRLLDVIDAFSLEKECHLAYAWFCCTQNEVRVAKHCYVN